MSQPPIDPERIADETGRRLLERASALDAQLTLDQLREAASEAGISNAAFDAAVAEWRQSPPAAPGIGAARSSATPILRNAAAIATGWMSVSILAGVVRAAGAPWLIHKLTDPVGLALGALIAARLQARTATILLGGLAVSQAAEFAMDLLTGAPAIHGFGAHIGLMVAGIAGVALGFRLRHATAGSGPRDATHSGTTDVPRTEDADDHDRTPSAYRTLKAARQEPNEGGFPSSDLWNSYGFARTRMRLTCSLARALPVSSG